MFYDSNLSVQEQRHLKDRRVVQRRLAEEQRRRVEACVDAFFSRGGT